MDRNRDRVLSWEELYSFDMKTAMNVAKSLFSAEKRVKEKPSYKVQLSFASPKIERMHQQVHGHIHEEL